MPSNARICHLDGLRGLACAAVVLLHGLGGFVPGLVEQDMTGGGWMEWLRQSPLRLLWDGDSAVFLFFALSGHVLTPSFTRHAAAPTALMAGRLTRFLVPALMACALGLAMTDLFGAARGLAAASLGAGWLGGDIAQDLSAVALLQDGLLNALVLGYRGLSVWDPVLGDLLWQNQVAFNPPLWTLSLEMQGSCLVLALVMARRRSALLGWALLAALAVLLIRSPLLCFLVGYGARFIPMPRGMRPLLLVAGMALCWGAGRAADPLATWLADAALPLLPALAADQLQRGLGAALVFLACVGPGGASGILTCRWVQWLGRLSFPLYLVHWPILYGPAAWVAAQAAPRLGPLAAGWLALGCGLALSVACAVPFRWIDRLALIWSRRIRAELTVAAPPWHPAPAR